MTVKGLSGQDVAAGGGDDEVVEVEVAVVLSWWWTGDLWCGAGVERARMERRRMVVRRVEACILRDCLGG